MTTRRPHLTLILTAVLALGLAGHLSNAAAQTYSLRIAAQNRMGVTLTNYGVIGNNFVDRSASMEFPSYLTWLWPVCRRSDLPIGERRPRPDWRRTTAPGGLAAA